MGDQLLAPNMMLRGFINTVAYLFSPIRFIALESVGALKSNAQKF